MEHVGKQQEIKYTITSSDKATLKEFDQKRTLFETMTKTKSFDRNPKHRALYHALMESILEDEDAMDKGVTVKLKKRKPDDADRDEDPLAGSDQGFKANPKDWFKKPKRPPTPDPEWNTSKTINGGPTQNWLRDRYPFDLSKPLPLAELRNRLIVPADYFFNNDLAYLQRGSTERTYTTSLTNTKAAKYDLKGIEDMVPTLWSPIKVVYDKHALLGTSYWKFKRQTFYGYASNRVSKHDVYSSKRILAVTIVKVNKWYGYGHLEEIKVRRAD
ncbi:hypothetical protein Tco_1468969 [Tanacetum coccineum]